MTPGAHAKHRPKAASLAVVVLPDASLLAESTGSRLLLAIVDAQSMTRPVHVAVTGGTSGIAALAAARRSPLLDAVDWSGVHIWWGDERFLPTGDPERNETQAREALLDHIPLPADQLHAIPGPDLADTPEEAADAYAAELARYAADGRDGMGSGASGGAAAAGGARIPGGAGIFGGPGTSNGAGTSGGAETSAAPLAVPAFDLVMLGVGPDGHVASLFPGLPGVREAARAVIGVRHSPKPPPERVSLTVPAIGQAREVWLIASGPEKAAPIARALSGRVGIDEVPAAAVRGRDRTLWLLDATAADAAPVAGPADEGGKAT